MRFFRLYYIVVRYSLACPMSSERTKVNKPKPEPKPEPKLGPVSFRVTAKFREALRRAAAAEQRSQANVLHVIIFDWCKRHGIELPGSVGKGAKKKAKK